VYVRSGAEVFVIDAATNTVSTSFPVKGTLGGAAVTGDGKTLYVIDSEGGAVAVFDTATNTEVAYVPVSAITGGVTVSPDGNKAYATSSNDTVTTITRGGTTEACTGSLCLPIPGR
jgi:YVTN family beta-propeller protein